MDSSLKEQSQVMESKETWMEHIIMATFMIIENTVQDLSKVLHSYNKKIRR